MKTESKPVTKLVHIEHWPNENLNGVYEKTAAFTGDWTLSTEMRVNNLATTAPISLINISSSILGTYLSPNLNLSWYFSYIPGATYRIFAKTVKTVSGERHFSDAEFSEQSFSFG